MDDDRNAPATKADLVESETRLKTLLKADLSELETRILARMDERETRMVDQLTEVIRDAQTETLKAFYGFVETVQTRFKAQDDTEAGLKKRLTVVEERLLEVEKKLLMPPAA
jgi:hypothetical protein